MHYTAINLILGVPSGSQRVADKANTESWMTISSCIFQPCIYLVPPKHRLHTLTRCMQKLTLKLETKLRIKHVSPLGPACPTSHVEHTGSSSLNDCFPPTRSKISSRIRGGSSPILKILRGCSCRYLEATSTFVVSLGLSTLTDARWNTPRTSRHQNLASITTTPAIRCPWLRESFPPATRRSSFATACCPVSTNEQLNSLLWRKAY